MNKWINLVLAGMLAALPITESVAKTGSTEGQLTLSYSDGRAASHGLQEVNKVLKTVGVRVSQTSIPSDAAPLLKVSEQRALNSAESSQLISLFHLHRGELLDQIKLAGREPEAHRGGFLSTLEIGVAPYPKVYDMKAMSPEVMHYLQEKFGKLHVNSADNGVGIDEVMTIVSGGPWTWFFVLPDNVIGKLTLGEVSYPGHAWRISYPGLVPHGGFLDAPHGLVVAFAHGPEHFVMRYEEPSVMGTEVLGTNSWIDFSGEVPQLLD
ncbi:hypothetical protein [Photobacterium sp. TY1-4]|uniref:hypothetical protein n=1 Tax=Photobacterium sp. TY1-4 TaxID=2899122 RepID=UPI0021C0FC27|nr:hypothetical protein [Photobacterium sp. TY1-4]UXI03087.1 hypothetical protein NH461_21855 [Photobacterium sp. TY1-4]